MATFQVDPTRFRAEGAVIDSVVLLRRLGVQNVPIDGLRPVTQLRWMIHAELGLPTEPFQVWARPHSSRDIAKKISFTQTPLLFLNINAITWPDGALGSVNLQFTAPTGGVIAAWVGSPSLENIVALQGVTAGTASLNLSAPVMDGLLVSTGISVAGIQGLTPDALSDAAGWTSIETVGLPVNEIDWSSFSKQGMKQGLTGALVEATEAAVQRLRRGAPPFGWGPFLEAGVPAPAWSAPDFGALVKEVQADLLDQVRAIAAAFPPDQQGKHKLTLPIPTPQNSAGKSMTAKSSSGLVSPLQMLLMAAGTDPFLSLVLGFGSAYPFVPDRETKRSAFDFRVTARWEKGLDGQSAPLDLAALIPQPGPAVAPAPPANLAAQVLGVLKPFDADGDWRGSVRVAWDRPPSAPLFRNTSFAAARVSLAPPEPAQALMEPRPSGGLRPIVINTPDAKDPERWRINFLDRELPIPHNPGSRTLRLGAAVQDIYGQWTPWAVIGASLTQPALDQVRLATARLISSVPAVGSLCPTRLEIEWLWDFSVRQPQRIRLAGQLYVAAEHGSPAPFGPPAGFGRSLGGGEGAIEVVFAGDVPSVVGAAGATIIGLTPDGETQAAFGPAQGADSRRFRLSVPGFSLDFGATGHIGLAVWAQCQERQTPNRLSAWSQNPIVVSASDPRPPVVPIEHVAFSSLPDASGEAHARIAWTSQPNASGYFIYESDETQILRALGRPEPTPSQTLDDRLKIIKDSFAAIPRRSFTRLNSTAIKGQNQDVVLPRGSTAIHLYIVIGASAGQVESDWPTNPDALMAVATPRIVVPAPPLLEVQRILDASTVPPRFAARIAVATRPGPRVQKIDLHRVRVDDAAKELDTMGPPVARLENSGAGWVLSKSSDAMATNFITQARGTDAPEGSWRRVWYRAVAWTGSDATRGGLPGRSPASTAAWLVIPPSDAPQISIIALGSGPTPPDLIAQWTSAAPVPKTPLGPHKLAVSAVLPGVTTPIFSLDAPLHSLPTAPPATGSGVWIVGTAGGLTTYRALLRRADGSDTIALAVRLSDPLGRTGEALVTVPGGALNPPPDLSALTLRKITLPPPARLTGSFSSSSPLEATLDGPYRISVTVSFPPLPRRPNAIIEMALGDVPRLPRLASSALGLFRQPGAGGAATTYLVIAPPQATRMTVRLTAPDGTSVTRTKNVV